MGRLQNECFKRYFLKHFIFKIWKRGLFSMLVVESRLGSFSSTWVRPFADNKSCSLQTCNFIPPSTWAKHCSHCLHVLRCWQGLKHNPLGTKKGCCCFLKCELFLFPTSFWSVAVHSKSIFLFLITAPYLGVFFILSHWGFFWATLVPKPLKIHLIFVSL